MRLSKIKRKNVTHYYIIESYRDGSKVTSRTIKKLGSDKEIKEKFNVTDVDAWAKKQVQKANSLKNPSNKTQDQSRYIGIGYINTLYEHFGIKEIISMLEKKEKIRRDELNTLLLFLILDCMYFPESSFSNIPFFQEGYFKNKPVNLSLMYKLHKAIAENYTLFIDAIGKRNNIQSKKSPLLFYNIEIDNSLILPNKSANKSYVGLLFNNKGIPITMLHSSFSKQVNKQNLQNVLKKYNFVDIYSNGDAFGIKKELPQKASLKTFKRLSIKEVKNLVNKRLTNDGTWSKLIFEQKQYLKEYADVLYKKYPIKGDKNHEVVAFYSNHFDVKDAENKINITYAMLENPQCIPKLKDNLNNFISRTAYNPTYNGYRYYLLPKDIPIYIAVSFDFTNSQLTRIFNNVPYSNSKFLRNATLEDFTFSAHIIYYISIVFSYYLIITSKYYISNINELSFFLQTIDATAVANQFESYIEQLNYRLKPNSD